MIAYPLCVAVVWAPSVLLGVLGTIEFAELRGPAANSILVLMIERHAPGALAGLLAAGVFAAVMSSLDSQTLSLATLLTRGVGSEKLRGDDRGQRQIWRGRVFVVLLLLLAYLLSLVVDRSIFRLGIWSFSGFSALLPLVLAAIYWRRSTRQGAIAAALGDGVAMDVLLPARLAGARLHPRRVRLDARRGPLRGLLGDPGHRFAADRTASLGASP